MLRSLLVLLLCACGGTVIDAARYSRACAQPSDCSAVFAGDACAVCACPNTAISASAKASYDADVAALKKLCGPQPAIACAPCAEPMPTCTNRTCGL